ncbi:MAG TPA: hypothetical protein VNT60_07210, partial [Deinococcales bacterium]|nr:hypothetical protein [Deinococcales bacterium]
AISPADFTGNIITFTFLRLVDTTSWMYDLPHWVPQVAKAAAALFFLACVGAVTLVPRRFDLRGRIIAAVACTIAITLVGFGVRRNYVLWWLPFATVLAAAHAVSFLPGKRLPFSVSPLAHPREDSCER